ncbi:MAG: nucleoside deaminase [Bacteroidales bacterium]|nr:nucleoside deaminase [Bacteroidales bacterium]
MILDEYYMRIALKEAKLALDKGEIPVGAIVVCNDTIVAKAHNQTEQLNDFTAHAEMLALSSASEYLSNKYLNQCTLYVTLEPCMMCAGATYWTQIGKIVYGASDIKRGFSNFTPSPTHPKVQIVSGILANECASLLTDFFSRERAGK